MVNIYTCSAVTEKKTKQRAEEDDGQDMIKEISVVLLIF